MCSYPMGFDSFGMPAENAAISEGGHPHDITERNMASITEQIKRMGFSYDWRRTLKSHDPPLLQMESVVLHQIHGERTGSA